MITLAALYNKTKRYLPGPVRRAISIARLRSINEPVIAYHFLSPRGRGSMIDVGAAHGSALTIFAGDGWRVWACEPNPENRTVLRQTADSFSDVTILPYAISNESSDAAPFYSSDLSTGLGSLKAFDPSHRPAYTIEVRTLADLFPDPLDVDFLKVDTEGYDLFVLKGIAWDRMHPRMILCEYDNHKSVPLGYRVEDMAQFLSDRGYHVWVSEFDSIDHYSELPEWRGFHQWGSKALDPLSTGNLFAVLPEDTERFDKILRQFEKAYRRHVQRAD